MLLRRLILLYFLTTATTMAANGRLNFSIVGGDAFDQEVSLYTIDGGNIWLPSKIKPDLGVRGYLTDISCNATGESCIALGQIGRIKAFSTQDAGRTWQPSYAHFPYPGYISLI